MTASTVDRDDVAQVLAEVLGQTQARHERRRALIEKFRAEHAPRRTAGKAAGHAARLARTHQPEGAPVAKEDSVKAGVADAWDHWLAERPVSVPELIEDAVKDAVTTWLNTNGEDIVARLLNEWRAKLARSTTNEMPSTGTNKETS